MYIPAHAGIGWLLAELGKGDSAFRRSVFLAAILPDIDGITYLFGSASSLNQHHVWSHNLLFSLVISALASVYCSQMRFRAFLFTQIAFYTHILGDYYLTQWPLTFFYPFSAKVFLNGHALALWDPINTLLGYLGCLVIIGLSIIFKRTPLEVLSPTLDAKLVTLISGAWAQLTQNKDR